MTWHHFLRSLVVAGAAAAVIALATGVRAEGGEGSLVPIDEVHQAVPPAPEPVVEAAEAPADPKPVKPAAKTRAGAKGSKAAKAAPPEPVLPAEAAPAPAIEAAPETAAEAPVVTAVAVAQPAAVPVEAPAEAVEAVEEEPAPRRSRRIKAEAKDAVRAAALRALVEHHAAEVGVPFHLADAVIRIESRYSAGARNGPNLGLTQINAATARSLGYQGGAAGLLDPETNLRFGLKYLARAYDLAKGDTCGTILRYQAGLRAQSMTRAARVYCVRVQTIIASAQ